MATYRVKNVMGIHKIVVNFEFESSCKRALSYELMGGVRIEGGAISLSVYVGYNTFFFYFNFLEVCFHA